MSKILLFISFLTLTLPIYSQTRYGYLMPDSSIVGITSISKTLYVGIDNKFDLNSTRINNYDTVLLKCNNGKVFFDSVYIAIPRRPGNLRIELHGIKNDVVVDTLGFYNFHVLPLPTPKITLDSLVIENNIKVSIGDFVNSDSLKLIITKDIPDSRNWIQIKEFSIGYTYGGHYIGANSSSSYITEEMKALVSKNGVGGCFLVKVITQSATSLLLANPIYKVFFY